MLSSKDLFVDGFVEPETDFVAIAPRTNLNAITKLRLVRLPGRTFHRGHPRGWVVVWRHWLRLRLSGRNPMADEVRPFLKERKSRPTGVRFTDFPTSVSPPGDGDLHQPPTPVVEVDACSVHGTITLAGGVLAVVVFIKVRKYLDVGATGVATTPHSARGELRPKQRDKDPNYDSDDDETK